MTIKRTSAGAGLPAGFPFSLASAANGIVYISGMPALGADGKFAPGTFAEEAGRAWGASWPSPRRAAAVPGTCCSCRCCWPTSATTPS